MPDQPTPALLAAARAYAETTWDYDGPYRTPRDRENHIGADAASTAEQPWFAALWNAGIAEGRRQATESPITLTVAADLTDDEAAELKARFQQAAQRPAVMTVLPESVDIRQREWAVRYPDGYVYDDVTEAAARDIAARYPHRVVISRLVGPWEPDEQPEPFTRETHGGWGAADTGQGWAPDRSGKDFDTRLPETLTVRLDNRNARFVPADPPVPYFEGDEALPPEPDAFPDGCPKSQRVDGPLHSWRFDGDDPRIECVFCGELRDALSGAVIREGDRG